MITSMSSSQTTTSISPSVQLESSTKKNPQSTPIRLTPQPQPLPSIPPIVSNLPQETARKLKKCRQNISSRKKYTHKCLEELFSADKLATSNVSGTSGKDKLDECKIGLISSKQLSSITMYIVNPSSKGMLHLTEQKPVQIFPNKE